MKKRKIAIGLFVLSVGLILFLLYHRSATHKMKLEQSKARFNSWWMAGLSILFAVTTLYFAWLNGSAHVQYASNIVLAQTLRETRTSITNDVRCLVPGDLLREVDKAMGITERMKKRASKIVIMSSLHNWIGLLSLTSAIGAFFGKPKIAAWVALPFGLYAGVLSCMWI